MHRVRVSDIILTFFSMHHGVSYRRPAALTTPLSLPEHIYCFIALIVTTVLSDLLNYLFHSESILRRLTPLLLLLLSQRLLDQILRRNQL